MWDTVGALGIPAPDAAWPRPAVDRFNRGWAFHDTEPSSWIAAAFQGLAIDEERSALCPALWHQQRGAAEPGQELRQVWFAGVHRDAGGGYRGERAVRHSSAVDGRTGPQMRAALPSRRPR
ncbi:DUF2235 domain-containing protein [Streptomyces sp. B3I7]|uniref:T6SS phospholipase effector Tle1-like catalytic domain-containing protein n=1 Tax=Streptomyces sp. B3I7 TaxID=3042269 RepID=UPI0027D88264|nr:DUF2235 domain-containing protein [Streptomyces sp. B3I7]